MAFIIADRVAETTTTTGTGTLNLGGPSTGFQSFVAGVGDGNTTFYVITDNTDWEVGIGTVTSGTPDTLSRDTVLRSTNTDAAVNWGSGTKDVFLSIPADRLPALNTDNTFTGDTTFSASVLFPDKSELTISGGEITVSGVNHTIDTESEAASDDLDTINGGSDGQILIVRAENDSRTVVLKHNTGNIFTDDASDVSLDANSKSALLMYDGTLSRWQVIARPLSVLGSDDITNDSTVSGSTVTDALETVQDSVVFTQFAESTGLTYDGDNEVTLSHSFGELPKGWSVCLVCTTAEGGYSIGDVLDPAGFNNANGERQCSVYMSTSSISVITGGNGFQAPNKSTHASFNLTPGNWTITIRAWA